MWELFKRKPEWIYGSCHGRLARKHRKKGNVQFILWSAGKQGHKENYWYNFDSSWWELFKPDNESLFSNIIK